MLAVGIKGNGRVAVGRKQEARSVHGTIMDNLWHSDEKGFGWQRVWAWRATRDGE